MVDKKDKIKIDKNYHKTNDWLDKEDISMLLMLVSSNDKVFDNYKNGKSYKKQLKHTLIRMSEKLTIEGYPDNDVFKVWR
tara:strand:+ start:1028 stop:1267 length:240 start_codon:yes stop_codon:yes gene_type:complete